jgi:hypothetical protein
MNVTDWLLRASDGNNFIASSKYNIWGVNSKETGKKTNDEHFLKDVKLGDRLWFIISKSKGKILAVATYLSHNKRELGPLINLTSSNTELGWADGSWDTEVHYTDLYNLSDCMLLTHIESPLNIRKYNEKCKILLSEAYENIKIYSRITRKM